MKERMDTRTHRITLWGSLCLALKRRWQALHPRDGGDREP